MNATSRRTVDVAEFAAEADREIGMSEWRVVSQADIDTFADVTGDDQFIHVDPARAAAETPFGGAIAHGFLTLSLLSILGRDVLPVIRGRRMGVNYGLDRVRFVSPVRAGARVRGRFTLRGIDRRPDGDALLRYGVVVEIEGSERPALVAEWLSLAVMGGA